MKVGFIGLGRMGTAMANRVLGAGRDIAVYNRTASKCSDLVAAGAKLAGSAAEAARFGGVVITMLANDRALSEVALGDEGLVASLPKGAIHLAMGTHSLALMRALTESHSRSGQILVGAPVLGRPPVAMAGQLGIITGGPADAVEKCRPLFAATDRGEMHRAALAAHQAIVARHQFAEHLLDRNAARHRVRVATISAEAEVAWLHCLGEACRNSFLAERQVARALHQILKEEVVRALLGLSQRILTAVEPEAGVLADVVVNFRCSNERCVTTRISRHSRFPILSQPHTLLRACRSPMPRSWYQWPHNASRNLKSKVDDRSDVITFR
jgi:prephenate dehydrogenase